MPTHVVANPHGRGFKARRFAACLLAACALLGPARAARAQSVRTRMWQTDGTVFAIAHDALHLYLGGQFNRIGPHTGGAAVLDVTTGTVPGDPPEVHGTVLAVAPDGAGGWYLGGLFDRVGEAARQNLAHVA